MRLTAFGRAWLRLVGFDNVWMRLPAVGRV